MKEEDVKIISIFLMTFNLKPTEVLLWWGQRWLDLGLKEYYVFIF